MALSIQDKQKIFKLKREGNSPVKISAATGFHTADITEALKEFGYQNGALRAQNAIDEKLNNAGIANADKGKKMYTGRKYDVHRVDMKDGSTEYHLYKHGYRQGSDSHTFAEAKKYADS